MSRVVFSGITPISDVVSKRGPDRQVDGETVLRVLSDAYPPALGTSDVSERIGVKRQTADNYLRDLWDEELVDSRMVGTVRVWWLTDKGRRRIDPDSTAGHPPDDGSQ